MFKKIIKRLGFSTISENQESKEHYDDIIELTDVVTEEEDLPKLNIKHIEFTKYQFTPSSIDSFYKLFRKHQIDTVNSLKGHDIGQVNNPTGTGKTFIQKYIHVSDMVEKTKNNESGVYVIAAHRLILCSQLFNEIIDLIVKCGLKTNLLYIGSGRHHFERLNYDYNKYGFSRDDIACLQTTSSKDVSEFVNKSIKDNHHVLIVSTYHSFDCLNDLDKIDICTFDEAHITTEDRFTENINLVKDKIKVKYFFTATRKVIGETEGQNNIDFYGPVLHEMSPRSAVELGEIVAPMLHFIKTISDEEDIDKKNNVGMLVKTVIDSFTKHNEKVKSMSYNPERISAKLLVANSGLDEIQCIVKDNIFIEWCTENNIQVFNISSKTGETAHNFDNDITRQEILEKMNQLTSEDKAILFHYDTLTEGIDLPAITGVMLFRSTIPFIKLLQNLGRACRLHPDDRKRLYSEEILVGQYSKMIKPHSWVILPTYINENWKYVEGIIRDLRISYNIKVEHVDLNDISNSIEEEPPESILEKVKHRKDSIRDIIHLFERIETEELDNQIEWSDDSITYLLGYIGNN